MEPLGRPTASLSPPGGSLFGFSGAQLRRLGVAFVVVGAVLFVSSMALPFLAIQGFMESWQQDPFAPRSPPILAFFLSFLIGGVGVVLLGLGGMALRLGLVRPVSGYVVTEASPAIEMGAAAVGRGLRDAMGPPGPAGAAPRPEVRVKCRNCGYLDTEDATYCSKCGSAL